MYNTIYKLIGLENQLFDLQEQTETIKKQISELNQNGGKKKKHRGKFAFFNCTKTYKKNRKTEFADCTTSEKQLESTPMMSSEEANTHNISDSEGENKNCEGCKRNEIETHPLLDEIFNLPEDKLLVLKKIVHLKMPVERDEIEQRIRSVSTSQTLVSYIHKYLVKLHQESPANEKNLSELEDSNWRNIGVITALTNIMWICILCQWFFNMCETIYHYLED